MCRRDPLSFPIRCILKEKRDVLLQNSILVYKESLSLCFLILLVELIGIEPPTSCMPYMFLLHHFIYITTHLPTFQGFFGLVCLLVFSAGYICLQVFSAQLLHNKPVRKVERELSIIINCLPIFIRLNFDLT